MLDDYRRARRRAQKRFQDDVSAGRYPYPPALDDILKGYGCAGEVNRSLTGASSTTLPVYMTATRCAVSATTPRSCVMSRETG